MDITVQTIHFDADQKLLDFTKSKTEKLGQFYDQIIGVEVYLKFEAKSSTVKEKTAEFKMLIPGATLFASRTSKTFEEAVDEAIESLTRQIKKHKEKIRN